MTENHKDADIAQRLADGLSRSGHNISLDRYLIPGHEWQHELRQALLAADGLIVVLSENSVGYDTKVSSQWVAADIGAARATGKFLIPVIIGDDVPIPALVSDIYAVRLGSRSEQELERGVHEIDEAIGAHIERRENAPTLFGDRYERLMARNNMLFSLLGEKRIGQTLTEFFPDALTPCIYKLHFSAAGTQNIGEYAEYFLIIDRVYRFLATLVNRDYFVQRWLIGALPTLSKDHLLSVYAITQSSPWQIEGSAIAEIVASLRDVLSIGKQLEDIRLSFVRVEEAKLALKRKQMELEDAKREEALRADLKPLNLEVEKTEK